MKGITTSVKRSNSKCEEEQQQAQRKVVTCTKEQQRAKEEERQHAKKNIINEALPSSLMDSNVNLN
jgi:hypothetical protein